MLRISDYTSEWVSTEACPKVKPGFKDKGIQRWGLSVVENGWKYTRHQCKEASPNLGRTLKSYCHYRHRGVLFGRFGQKAISPAMECPQFEGILPLIVSPRGYGLNVMLYVHNIN